MHPWLVSLNDSCMVRARNLPLALNVHAKPMSPNYSMVAEQLTETQRLVCWLALRIDA